MIGAAQMCRIAEFLPKIMVVLLLAFLAFRLDKSAVLKQSPSISLNCLGAPQSRLRKQLKTYGGGGGGWPQQLPRRWPF
jgi:hypothetical protein